VLRFGGGGKPQRISSSERSPFLALQTPGASWSGKISGSVGRFARAIVLDVEQAAHRLLRLGNGIEITHSKLRLSPPSRYRLRLAAKPPFALRGVYHRGIVVPAAGHMVDPLALAADVSLYDALTGGGVA